MSSKAPVFQTSLGTLSSPHALLFGTVFKTLFNSSRVKFPVSIGWALKGDISVSFDLMSGTLPSRFEKCSFHLCRRSLLSFARSLAVFVVFLPLGI